MSLVNELKERREAVANRLEDAYVSTGTLRAELDDLDRAIAALEPEPTDEQPELFKDEKVEALEQLETDHALPPSADDVVVEEAPEPEFIELDEQTCEPVEEAPALNEAMQDEREQPVEEGYAPVTNPEADAWSAPVETTPGTLTEYVPPTNPEADFWAQTLTEQPKPQSYSPFSIFRREKEDA